MTRKRAQAAKPLFPEDGRGRLRHIHTLLNGHSLFPPASNAMIQNRRIAEKHFLVLCRSWLLFVLLMWLPCRGNASEDPLALLPQLAPERCAMQSPDALFAKLLRLEPVPEGIENSDACMDRFYQVYAAQLARKTDADFPDNRKFRALLLECFQTCFHYIAGIHHHNGVKHYSSRIPGQLEWILYHAATQQYGGYTEFGGNDLFARAWLDDESQYTPALIEQIAVAIGKANAFLGSDHFEKSLLPILKRALDQLAKAEESMNDDQKRYFRRYLALFITRFP
ncbi:MAG: hypothetical protein V4710_11345 [Verrucomicrobiota bacterium]